MILQSLYPRHSTRAIQECARPNLSRLGHQRGQFGRELTEVRALHMRFDGILVLVPTVKTSVRTWGYWSWSYRVWVDVPRHNGRGKSIPVEWDEGSEATKRRNMV